MFISSENIWIGNGVSVHPSEVILLSAEINYTIIHFSNGRKKMVAIPLKELERRFSICPSFFRPHKSYLINMSYIRHCNMLVKAPFLEMNNNVKVMISRRKKVAFKRKISE